MHKLLALRRELNLSLSQLTFSFKFLYLRNNLFFGPKNIFGKKISDTKKIINMKKTPLVWKESLRDDPIIKLVTTKLI